MEMYIVMEYIKVFVGYIFLMFIWPSVVFGNYLRRKSKIFRFSFCVTIQIILVNTIVLMLGFFHILDEKVIKCLFYGMFLFSVCRGIKGDLFGKGILQRLKLVVHNWFKDNVGTVKSRMGEYVLLFLVILYGMIYISYGSFQIFSYGQYDTFVHHGWINKMTEGYIFPEGVYPEAMHCFVYCIYALFDIRIYSIMHFMQCIHIMVYLLSAYGLMREIFRWQYTPIFTLGLYLTMDFSVTSMTRLQGTLPMEFGLHTQFLCGLYLIRYLKNREYSVIERKYFKGYLDENIIIFAASVAASVATHYYATIMAAIICVSVVLFNLKKVFCFRRLTTLAAATFSGIFIAVMPMIIPLVSGIPFEPSIYWGLNMINNNKAENELQVEYEAELEKTLIDPFALTMEDIDVVEKVPENGQKVIKGIIKLEYLLKAVYKKGYLIIYGSYRGRRIFIITIAVACFCIINKKMRNRNLSVISSGYPPFILVSFLSVLIFIAYNSPELGLTVLIPDHRFFPSGHLITLAVMLMPADILFSVGTRLFTYRVLQIGSVLFTGGIYLLINTLGIYHEYLQFSLMRYEAVAMVTESIINEFQKDEYTIVSPIDEVHQVELYGKHQEISEFIWNCEDEYYSLPTKYVFIYVEKRPIEYCQEYFFNGPAWLAKGRNSVVNATEISADAANEDMSKYTNASWWLYIDGRTILESKAYEWCQDFAKRHPSELNVYYEDNDFVCYFFQQDVNMPYNLAILD